MVCKKQKLPRLSADHVGLILPDGGGLALEPDRLPRLPRESKHLAAISAGQIARDARDRDARWSRIAEKRTGLNCWKLALLRFVRSRFNFAQSSLYKVAAYYYIRGKKAINFTRVFLTTFWRRLRGAH